MGWWSGLFGTEVKPVVREAVDEQVARLPIGYTPERWAREQAEHARMQVAKDASARDGGPRTVYPRDEGLDGVWHKVPNFRDDRTHVQAVVEDVEGLARLKRKRVEQMAEQYHRAMPHVHSGSAYVLVRQFPDSLYMFIWD